MSSITTSTKARTIPTKVTRTDVLWNSDDWIAPAVQSSVAFGRTDGYFDCSIPAVTPASRSRACTPIGSHRGRGDGNPPTVAPLGAAPGRIGAPSTAIAPEVLADSDAQAVRLAVLGQLGGVRGLDQILFGNPVECQCPDDTGMAEGEGASLVQDDGVDFAQRLEVDAAFDDGLVGGGAADPAQDGKGHARGDAACSGDDHHRDGGDDVASDQVGDGGGEGEVDEVAGELVGEPLHRRPEVLSLGDGWTIRP